MCEWCATEDNFVQRIGKYVEERDDGTLLESHQYLPGNTDTGEPVSHSKYENKTS
jgi:hypothetical protein